MFDHLCLPQDRQEGKDGLANGEPIKTLLCPTFFCAVSFANAPCIQSRTNSLSADGKNISSVVRKAARHSRFSNCSSATRLASHWIRQAEISMLPLLTLARRLCKASVESILQRKHEGRIIRCPHSSSFHVMWV